VTKGRPVRDSTWIRRRCWSAASVAQDLTKQWESGVEQASEEEAKVEVGTLEIPAKGVNVMLTNGNAKPTQCWGTSMAAKTSVCSIFLFLSQPTFDKRTDGIWVSKAEID
jgi:hypothetical protein